MVFLKSLLDKLTTSSVIENISDMWLTYSKDNTDTGCRPTIKLIEREVTCLLNQYPKEWIVNEIERDELLKYDLAKIRTIEPWWKVILSNKALLPMLWSMYPNHPNLLPAYYDNPVLYQTGEDIKEIMRKEKWVSKPLFGREGVGILQSKNFTSFDDFVSKTESNFGRDKTTGKPNGKSVYQHYHKLPEAQGRVIQTSSWVIAGVAAGINFREGKAGTNFADMNPFLPHLVVKAPPS